MENKHVGVVTQVIGPVIDVRFDDGKMPDILNAIEVNWGGRRLIDEYGVRTDKENAAEAWVLSCHPNGCGVISGGEYDGKTLRSVYEADRSICGTRGARFPEFPILIKFIDARDNLSIQVHPDEAYARRVEHGAGKTECWYILDADADAELALGFRGAIDRETFRRSIARIRCFALQPSRGLQKFCG